MPKRAPLLRRATTAALAAASLLLPPLLPVTQADLRAEAASTAKTHPKKHKQRQTAHTNLYAPAPNPPGCTWPYQNMFPPCMSTWPQGSPSYHGARPGVTFE